MGVKSTVILTREEAEKKYVDLKLKDESLVRTLRAEAAQMGEVQLENELETLNDKQAGGEGFENYLISSSR